MISGYSEKALLYSVQHAHKHTEGDTVARLGQTALRAYTRVCDCGARTEINMNIPSETQRITDKTQTEHVIQSHLIFSCCVLHNVAL